MKQLYIDEPKKWKTRELCRIHTAISYKSISCMNLPQFPCLPFCGLISIQLHYLCKFSSPIRNLFVEKSVYIYNRVNWSFPTKIFSEKKVFYLEEVLYFELASMEKLWTEAIPYCMYCPLYICYLHSAHCTKVQGGRGITLLYTQVHLCIRIGNLYLEGNAPIFFYKRGIKDYERDIDEHGLFCYRQLANLRFVHGIHQSATIKLTQVLIFAEWWVTVDFDSQYKTL